MVGQVCFAAGEAKNTYGTGNFLLLNTGEKIVRSQQRPAHHGLLPVRRREAGLRPGGFDRRHRLGRAVAARPARHHHRRRRRVETLARQVDDNGGVYFVPAFSGLFAPYWRSRRPRRDRRAVAVQHQRPPGAGHAGGDLLPEPRRRRRDGGRLRCAPRRAQGRRRHHRQRAVHADPGRRARRAGEQAGRRRDDRARRGLRGRAGGRLLVGHRRAARQLARGRALGAAVERRAARDGYAGWQKAVQRTLDWVDVE